MSTITSSSLLEDADAVVREYLTWRGFASTLQQFTIDQREDLLLGLSSKRLVQKLASDIESLNIDGLFVWWDDGVGPLLGRVDEEVAAVGRGLRDATYRWYLIACFKQQRIDLILAFFKDHWPARIGSSRFRDEWRKQWFVLPYTPNPERDRYFSVFFSNDWKTTLVASLETFLNSLLSALPPPRLVALTSVKELLDALRTEVEALKLENKTCHAKAMMPTPVLNADISSSVVESISSTAMEDYAAEEADDFSLIGKKTGQILRARFSPSCALIAACGTDASVGIWPSISSGSSQKPCRLFCDSTASCFDWFDDSLVCVGTLDHAVHLWTPSGTGGNKIVSLRTSATLPHILGVAVDPSSSSQSPLIVVSAASAVSGLPGELQLWNSGAERLERVLPVEPAPSRTYGMEFNHNGTMLVTGSADGMIRVFDVSRSGAIMGWPTTESGVSAIALSPDENSIFSLSGDGRTVTEWSIHRMSEAIRKWELPMDPPVAVASSTNHPEPHVNSIGDIAVTRAHLAACFNNSASVFPLLASDDAADSSQLPRHFPKVITVDWDENTLLCGRSDGVVNTYQV